MSDVSNWVLKFSDADDLVGWSAITQYLDSKGYRMVAAVPQGTSIIYDVSYQGGMAVRDGLKSTSVDSYRLFVVKD